MNNTKDSYSVNDLLNELNEIQMSMDEEGFFHSLMNTGRSGQHTKSRKMAILIKMFPVPIDKEDMLRFMDIVTSHIDTYFIIHKNRIEKEMSRTDFKRAELLTDTWISKMKQVYKKAKEL